MNERPDGYRLIELLGKGGLSEVRKAEAPGGLFVALKIVFLQFMAEEQMERGLQVLHRIVQIRHPSLTPIHAFGRREDRFFMVMDLADGDVRRRCTQAREKRDAGPSRERLLSWFEAVAAGLDALHEAGVVHRNVKPSNILLHAGGAWLGGLGLNQALIDAKPDDSDFFGTPRYMAPEQWHGVASPKSDQYALACSFAELRLGAPVFTGGDLAALKDAHQHGEPNLNSLPKKEQPILRRALSKEPADRFGSCGQLMEALRR